MHRLRRNDDMSSSRIRRVATQPGRTASELLRNQVAFGERLRRAPL
jgi:hypothetical protein